MSCLTSFKSYLTPRNSHEFTVRIKEENSQREIITFILFAAVVYKGHGRDVYLGMNILLPFCYTVFFMQEKGLFKSLP